MNYSSAQLAEMRFQDFCALWMNEQVETNLRERTAQRYEQFSRRTYEALGDIKVRDLSARDIQCFVNHLSQDSVNQKTGGGLSPKTIRGYLTFISGALQYAWRMDAIPANPCPKVILPPLNPPAHKMMTLDQAKYFVTCLNDAPIKYHLFFKLALFSGLRRGELLGLEWNDIDFDHSLIFVRRNSQYTKRRGIYAEKPKTAAGERILHLPDFLFQLMRALKREQVFDALKGKCQYPQSDGRLFLGNGGSPLHPNCPYNWLKRFCANIGLPFYGVHQFRHLNASLLISNGTDPKTVSFALGHTQVSTTLNIYAHEFAYRQALASEAIGNAIIENLL